MLLPMPRVEFDCNTDGVVEKDIEAEITRRTFIPHRLFIPSHVAIDFEILSIKTRRKIRASRDDSESANWIDEELLIGEGAVSAVVFTELTKLNNFEVEPLKKGDKIVLKVGFVHPNLSGKRFFTATWDGV